MAYKEEGGVSVRLEAKCSAPRAVSTMKGGGGDAWPGLKRTRGDARLRDPPQWNGAKRRRDRKFITETMQFRRPLFSHIFYTPPKKNDSTIPAKKSRVLLGIEDIEMKAENVVPLYSSPPSLFFGGPRYP